MWRRKPGTEQENPPAIRQRGSCEDHREWGAGSVPRHSALKDLLQPCPRSPSPPGIQRLGNVPEKQASNPSHTWASGALWVDPETSLLRKQRQSSFTVPCSFLLKARLFCLWLHRWCLRQSRPRERLNELMNACTFLTG